MKERGDLKQAHHDTLVRPLQALGAGQQGLPRGAPACLRPVAPPLGWRRAAASLACMSVPSGELTPAAGAPRHPSERSTAPWDMMSHAMAPGAMAHPGDGTQMKPLPECYLALAFSGKQACMGRNLWMVLASAAHKHDEAGACHCRVWGGCMHACSRIPTVVACTLQSSAVRWESMLRLAAHIIVLQQGGR